MLEFYSNKFHISRKEHKCDLCGKIIHIGEKYNRYSGKYDGDMFDDCYRMTCRNIIDAFNDANGYDEYNIDWINDWLHDTYCLDCEHYENDECEYTNCSCPIIRSHFEKEN